jgi:hypothetical protein
MFQLDPSVEKEDEMKKVLLPTVVFVCLLAVTPVHAQSRARVPGFRPSTSGFRFSNSFPNMPYFTINAGAVNVPIGDASNGMCGGMVYAVRDYFEAGYLAPPPNATPPASGPLFDYLSRRLFDSFSLPAGPGKYLHLMNPALPDHETDFSRLGLAPHGRAWVMIVEEWPRIKADLDQGRLSPLALIRIKDVNAFNMGKNHQVMAYGYSLNGNDLVIDVYDPNYPGNDYITISLNIGDPQHTTPVSYSTGEEMYCFFRTDYTYAAPPAPNSTASKLTGDFNGDGKTDIALTGRAGWNTLPVAFSYGNGAFTVTNQYVGDFASWASDRRAEKLTGDFNGDGKTDVALTGPPWWNTLPVACSNGNGGFTVTNSFVGDFAAWSSNRETTKLTGDFNGDGKTEIALNGPSSWNTVPVALSNGNGTFAVTNYYIGDFAAWANDLHAAKLTGDFNGDGKTDIALTGAANWNTVPVAFSNGNGTFTVTNIYLGSFAACAAVPGATTLTGDFNGDGKTDIALTGPYWWNTLPVAFSNGNGSFTMTNVHLDDFPDWASSSNAVKLVGDFNGDGKADVAVTGGSGWDSVVVAFSNGNGSFTATRLAVPGFPSWAADPYAAKLLGDFNGDGKSDIALTGPPWWNTLPVAFSYGNGTFFVTNLASGSFASWATQSPL